MSKLAYFSITLVGAVPAGGSGYLLVQHFLDHGFSGSPVIVGIAGTALASMFLIVLTPLMVLFWYKSPNAGAPKPAATAAAEEKAEKEDSKKDAKPAKGKKGKDDGFDDAIPDDFNEDELNESADDAFDAGDEDFEYEDDEFEEEEEQPKKKKKK